MQTSLPSVRPFWRRFFWPLLLLPIVVGGIWLSFQSYEITVTEVQAQTLLDAQLAKMQTENKAYNITSAVIDFRENEMSIAVAGSYNARVGKFPEQTLVAELSGVGDPDYRRGSIYFKATEFTLQSFTMNGKQPGDVAKELIAEAAVTIVPDARNSVLQNDKVKSWLDKAGISVDETQNDVAISGAALAAEALVEEYRAEGKKLLEASVLHLLETTPVYTLGKNWKEQLAMAALSDIGIKDGVFTATLTGAQLLWTLFTLVLTGLVAVAWTIGAMRGNGAGIGTAIVLGSL
jgi:uncharacterized protein (DUF2267 family)